MRNIKDIMTTIAGALGFVSGAILAVAAAGVVLPAIVLTIAAVAGSLSVFIIGWYNGKNNDGSSKTPEQLNAQVNPPTFPQAAPAEK